MLSEFSGMRKSNLELFLPKILDFYILHAWIIGIFDSKYCSVLIHLTFPKLCFPDHPQKEFETPASCWLNYPLLNISYSRFLLFF